MIYQIDKLLRERILVLDGAMGTMIQRYNLVESDYRGNRFSDFELDQKGNNDLLCLTQPSIIQAIHREYLEVGVDILETNTFNANRISMSDYGMESCVAEINFEAARLAKEVALEFSQNDSLKPRFIAGSIGPTNKTCSMSADVNDPAHRAVSFDELVDCYAEQIEALIRGGVDLLLIETIFDTLNAKAALYAVDCVCEKMNIRLPIMLSVTLSDKGGRTLSGQTLDAFLTSVSHAELLSIGLNCSFGARDMKPFLKELGDKIGCFVSAYPNAGLPNQFGEYDETPEKMASQVKEYIDEKLVNILGGCCGTTPDHIAQYAQMIDGVAPRVVKPCEPVLALAGLERYEVKRENNFAVIGERCNVAGSRKFLRLIKEGNYEEALVIAKDQVDMGTQILDVNMDDGLLDVRKEMVHFLNLLSSEPEIARIPVMIDSSNWEVLIAGIKCLQGKSIVNSISLKEGENQFIEYATQIKKLGAAVVVMAFDEVGQADTFERKISICERAYRILVDQVGFPPTDIIFDPNILAVATGIEEHAEYGLNFIRATKWIKEHLPYAKISGGVSNLSFSFRGNNGVREAMHSVFLYHAIQSGMDMGIVNPSENIVYSSIEPGLLQKIEDVLFNRHPEATERLIEAAEAMKGEATPERQAQAQEWRSLPLEDRLVWSLKKGIDNFLATDMNEALAHYPKAIDVIDQPLMKGMNEVGALFSEGKLFLPQVVKSARTMKKAVAILQPIIELENAHKSSNKAGKVIIATVKGDVHDIGKNIVGVILSCNNYDVIDLGVMVPKEEIVRVTLIEKPDFVGLSGLITPSLQEMAELIKAFKEAGITVPILIGGATTSKLHTAVKLAPLTDHPVIYAKDASQLPGVLSSWMELKNRTILATNLSAEYAQLRETVRVPETISKEQALLKRWRWDEHPIVPLKPSFLGVRTIHFSIAQVVPYINWKFFLSLWKISPRLADLIDSLHCEGCLNSWILQHAPQEKEKALEAASLIRDAQAKLKEWSTLQSVGMTARLGFFKAVGLDGSINLYTNEKEIVEFPTPRQLTRQKNDIQHALCDFIAPKSALLDDYVGAFAVTINGGLLDQIEQAKSSGDDYLSILSQALSDRLAEAATELLHEQVRKEYWGYNPHEALLVADLFAVRYNGIRPAIGYPSIPNLKTNSTIDLLLNFSSINITLTEQGAMYPQASVSGLLFAHPESKYFSVL